MSEHEETEALLAAFVLGQTVMQDAIIEKLKGYDAHKCAQIAAGVPTCNGIAKFEKYSGPAFGPLTKALIKQGEKIMKEGKK